MFTKLWKAISPPIDAAMIVPAVSFAFPAIETHSIAISISSMITTILPLKPNSSPITANGIAGHLAPVSFGTGGEGYGSCCSRFSQGKAAAGETGILAEAVREEVKN